jgi:hypothetical protein
MMKAIVIAACCFFALPVFSQTNIPSEDAYKHVGDTVRVCGKIFSARFLENSGKQPTLLNMGDKFPSQHVTVVLYGDNRNKFGYKLEETLLNKNVCVVGKVEMFKEKPQIVISDPFQVKVQ